MKTVYESETMENLNLLDIVEDMEEYEKFIYVCFSGQTWFAIKINDNYVAWLNGSCKFIPAQVYKNVLSIGSGAVWEFETFSEIKEMADKWSKKALEEITS